MIGDSRFQQYKVSSPPNVCKRQRRLAEVYACKESEKKFVAAWTKVMSLDRFDLA